MIAAAAVLNVIGNHFQEEASYRNDSQAVDWDRQTVIMIGAPVANLHARFMLARASEPLAAKLPGLVEQERSQDSPGSWRIVDRRDGAEYFTHDRLDYGLVLRIRNEFAVNRRYWMFLVAGIHAENTQEAGRMLQQNWRSLTDDADVSGFIFEMDFGRPGTGKIVKRVS